MSLTHCAKQTCKSLVWVHPDNIIEVKTFVLRRLPVLIYNPQPSKQIEANRRDPTINSLYFDNPKFTLYTDKISKTAEAASLRLRWYGQLSQGPDIYIERKTLKGGAAESDSEGAIEERLAIKGKYVKDFINGTYSMEKYVQRMKERGAKAEEVAKYESLVESMQSFIREKGLEPMMRAVYTRTAFQIPGDDRIRVSLDTDLALIREDCLDLERSCRDPEDWHRRDIDEAEMEYPFKTLRKGEISRFPYALLEIKVLDSALHGRSKEWISDLINSHLLKGAPRFSKFAHGIAALFDDYVNSFPFWLSEIDKDIRQDPKQAWEAEQEKAKKQIEDETIVGSFKPSVRDFGGRANSPRNPLSGLLSQTPPVTDRRFPMIAEGRLRSGEEGDVSERTDSVDELTDDEDKPTTVTTVSGLRNLFPTFSTSRYGRAHRNRAAVKLPPGVQKPGTLIMHSGPVQVEAKVWLANQRTFLKWQHVSILLASLSIGLYNAAGAHNYIARWLALVYTAIAVFAAAWGYGMYMWRGRLIRERSGKDFDNALGPVVVCVALAVALGLNFAFQVSLLVFFLFPFRAIYGLGRGLLIGWWYSTVRRWRSTTAATRMRRRFTNSSARPLDCCKRESFSCCNVMRYAARPVPGHEGCDVQLRMRLVGGDASLPLDGERNLVRTESMGAIEVMVTVSFFSCFFFSSFYFSLVLLASFGSRLGAQCLLYFVVF